ncbi:FH protein interacting protein FIP2, partial [Tanacetum coccineum]
FHRLLSKIKAFQLQPDIDRKTTLAIYTISVLNNVLTTLHLIWGIDSLQSFSSSSRQKHMLVLFSIARSISIINTFVSPAPYLCHEVVDVNSDLAIAHWSSSCSFMTRYEKYYDLGDLEVDAGIVQEVHSSASPCLKLLASAGLASAIVYLYLQPCILHPPENYACLIDCSFCGADLRSASAVTDNFVNFFVTHWRFLISSFLYLQTSDLTNANLEGANLEGANLKV